MVDVENDAPAASEEPSHLEAKSSPAVDDLTDDASNADPDPRSREKSEPEPLHGA